MSQNGHAYNTVRNELINEVGRDEVVKPGGKVKKFKLSKKAAHTLFKYINKNN